MAITRLARTVAGRASYGVPCTTSAIDTRGATLLVVVATGYSVPSITDSAGNTWTALSTYASGNPKVGLYYCVNPATSASHTVSTTGITGFPALAFYAYSGTDTSSPYVSVSGNTGTSVTSLAACSAPVTPPVDGCLLVAGICNDIGEAPTVGGGFSALGYASPGNYSVTVGSADLVQTTAAGAQPTFAWTTAYNGAATIAIFKPAVPSIFAATGSATVTGLAAFLAASAGSAAATGRAASLFSSAGLAASAGRAASLFSASGVAAVDGKPLILNVHTFSPATLRSRVIPLIPNPRLGRVRPL